jgi:hypothetical protein
MPVQTATLTFRNLHPAYDMRMARKKDTMVYMKLYFYKGIA